MINSMLRLTSICARAEKTLFFTSEEAKLHILLEGDALASDCTSHSNNSSRTTAIIITSWSTDATEGTSAVVVGAEKDGLVGVLD